MSFNRTFMELKQIWKRGTLAVFVCFNRTFMELKQDYADKILTPEEF